MTLKSTREQNSNHDHSTMLAILAPDQRLATWLRVKETERGSRSRLSTNRSNKYSDQLVCICPAKLVAKRHWLCGGTRPNARCQAQSSSSRIAPCYLCRSERNGVVKYSPACIILATTPILGTEYKAWPKRLNELGFHPTIHGGEVHPIGSMHIR